ncbi:sigma-54 dependent transcriptional regulator [Halodesulfovibrio sp.]|jgi:DNA-binding NtrC family response regulator|uniref:sigma-54 interaction domain-containing protein n=1 Tax=Halodesulfovibrio sp. TaxID=1912772 RepID=UPI0025F85D00|nr:sigma-54 dependent transcriptional regulator [Halodesulfovibrio sp.]MCT4535563.1 sigma-54 dependent transcriptional regulator [Halodesulfovibrio sp.]
MPATEPTVFTHLLAVCDSIAQGSYDQARDLYQLTQTETTPAIVSELAEAFGLMLVKLEAREFHLEQIIEELTATRDKLEQARALLAKENTSLKRDLQNKYAAVNIIGSNSKMQSLLKQLERVADAPVTVLLAGETGVGKDLLAKTLHYSSTRASHPYVALNCSAIPETLLESELFGIEKGVASGVSARVGRFEQADGGTLFLDEIGDMPLASQAKILRVIENGEVERVGGRDTITINTRLIAATHKDLQAMVKEGTFREDLFYRLNVLQLEIPPLRERPDDIPLLVKHFLETSVVQIGREIRGFSPEAMHALTQYDWPGNVRQLENEVARAVVLSQNETIGISDLSPKFAPAARTTQEPTAAGIFELMPLRNAEIQLIRMALKKSNNNKSEAARILGISREGLRKKLNRYKL